MVISFGSNENISNLLSHFISLHWLEVKSKMLTSNSRGHPCILPDFSVTLSVIHYLFAQNLSDFLFFIRKYLLLEIVTLTIPHRNV